MALDALRSLNPPDALRELKRIYQKYKRAEDADRALREKRISDGTWQLWEIPPERCVRGALHGSLVQAIGDFGDREFERQISKEYLQKGILWDEVKRAEDQLVKSGAIRESHRVAEAAPDR